MELQRIRKEREEKRKSPTHAAAKVCRWREPPASRTQIAAHASRTCPDAVLAIAMSQRKLQPTRLQHVHRSGPALAFHCDVKGREVARPPPSAWLQAALAAVSLSKETPSMADKLAKLQPEGGKQDKAGAKGDKGKWASSRADAPPARVLTKEEKRARARKRQRELLAQSRPSKPAAKPAKKKPPRKARPSTRRTPAAQRGVNGNSKPPPRTSPKAADAAKAAKAEKAEKEAKAKAAREARAKASRDARAAARAARPRPKPKPKPKELTKEEAQLARKALMDELREVMWRVWPSVRVKCALARGDGGAAPLEAPRSRVCVCDCGAVRSQRACAAQRVEREGEQIVCLRFCLFVRLL